jgi:putative membrane protein
MCRGDNGRLDYDGLRSQFISAEMSDTINNINTKYQRYSNKDASKKILEMNLPNDTILMFIEKDIRTIINKLNFSDVGKTALNGLLNEIIDASQKLYGIANVPVVHVYNQFINTCIVSYLIIFTLSMVTVSGWYTGIWVFIWSSVIFLANEVSNQIDTPFGCEENDIELEIILNNTKNQFTLFLTDVIGS